MWTAFGPPNVAIHRMTTAMELCDVQVAVDLGPRVDASGLPVERQVRHAIETARAYSARNRRDDALGVLLDAEQVTPEQIKHHAISRQLVLSWLRNHRGPRSVPLAERHVRDPASRCQRAVPRRRQPGAARPPHLPWLGQGNTTAVTPQE